MATWVKDSPLGTWMIKDSRPYIVDNWYIIEDAFGRDHLFPGSTASAAFEDYLGTHIYTTFATSGGSAYARLYADSNYLYIQTKPGASGDWNTIAKLAVGSGFSLEIFDAARTAPSGCFRILNDDNKISFQAPGTGGWVTSFSVYGSGHSGGMKNIDVGSGVLWDGVNPASHTHGSSGGGQIGSGVIEDNAIGNDQIIEDAITTGKIADDNVYLTHFGSGGPVVFALPTKATTGNRFTTTSTSFTNKLTCRVYVPTNATILRMYASVKTSGSTAWFRPYIDASYNASGSTTSTSYEWQTADMDVSAISGWKNINIHIKASAGKTAYLNGFTLQWI